MFYRYIFLPPNGLFVFTAFVEMSAEINGKFVFQNIRLYNPKQKYVISNYFIQP